MKKRIYSITPPAIFDLLANHCEVPEDIKLLSAYFDNERETFCLTITSEEFNEAPEGSTIDVETVWAPEFKSESS